MVQAVVPVQAPPHPLKTEFASGTAVKEKLVPALILGLQVAPQLKPRLVDETVPPPVPDLVIDKGYWMGETVGVRTLTVLFGDSEKYTRPSEATDTAHGLDNLTRVARTLLFPG